MVAVGANGCGFVSREKSGWGDSHEEGHGMQEFPPNGDNDTINMTTAP